MVSHADFCDWLFCEKASWWPGGKGVARKKHRPANFGFRIADFGFWVFLFQSAFRNQQFAISEARPVQEMIPALWFLGITALLPGRAMPAFQ
jgi:hypothetical protein